MCTKLILLKRVFPILAMPILLTGVLLALLAFSLPVYATQSGGTIAVTTTLDEFGMGSNCSLREAIESANTDTNFGNCVRNGSAPYTITLPANTYTLTGDADEDDNETGDLDLRASMNIVGNSAERTIIQAGNTLSDSVDRVFHITTDTLTVTIANVTIQHGNIESGYGGGILNEGTLVITGSQIMSNLANLGGGINNISQNSHSTVTLTILGSTISHNSAHLGGGIGNYGDGDTNSNATLTISGSIISHNSTAIDCCFGGGIDNYKGDLEISNSTISHNWAYFGGGINNLATTENSNATVTLNGSTISYNSAAGGGGINNLATTENSNATVTLNASTISDNSATYGGGIRNLDDNGHAMVTLNESTISDNSAEFGGGIDNSSQLELSNSTISDNSAEFGGGIVNYGSADHDPTVTLNASTISGNSADNVGGIVNYAGGGTVTVTLNASTISGNSALDVGGIRNYADDGSATVTFNASTISGNSADNVGGIVNDADGDGNATTNLKNSIIESNSSGSGQADDCSGTLDSYGYNLIQDTSDCTIVDVENPSTNITGQEAQLGPLADNDGPTETHALLSGSPAIDSASCTDIDGNPITIDQRGYPRPEGMGCDIGSFELSEFASIMLAPSHFEQRLVEGASATETLTISNVGFGQLEWIADEDVAWLSVSPMSGTVSADSAISITLSIDASNLTPDNYTGTLTITSNDLANPSLSVSVSLTVTSPATSTPTPTATTTASATSTATQTPQATATATSTMTPTMTPTITPTATPTITDNDHDGVDDDVEDGAPNDGDGNLDGIPDSEQDNVTSLLTVHGDYVTLTSPEGTTLLEVQSMPEVDDMPAPFDFSQGLLDFKIAASSAVSVTLILHNDDEMPDSYWKFGPTLDKPTSHWYEFTFDGTTGAVISEQMITLHFVDGQRGDADGIKNGQIVDPGAPAWRTQWQLFLPLTQR